MVALFVSIAVGFLAGALLPSTPAWVRWSQRWVLGSVLLVVGVQGALLVWSGELVSGGVRLIGASVVLAVLLLVLTLALVEVPFRLWGRPWSPPEGAGERAESATSASGDSAWRTAGLLLACLGAGTFLGFLALPWADTLQAGADLPLLLLLAAIGLDLGLQRGPVGRALRAGRRYLLVPVLAVLAAVLAGLAATLVLPFAAPGLVAGASGMGFYSLTGPLLTQLDGPAIGTVVFLANLWRELSAMILTPVFARWGLHPATAAAWGGATAMDSTLPFLLRAYGAEGVVAGLAVGVALSVAVPMGLPLLFEAVGELIG